MGSDCLKPSRAPGPLPSSSMDFAKTSKREVISPCLLDVIFNGWEGSRARLEPIPAALEKRSSLLYSTEILILPRLYATDSQQGKSRSTLHSSFFFLSVSFFSQPALCFLSCNLHYFPVLVISVLSWFVFIFSYFLLPFSPFSFSFQSCSFSQASSFSCCFGVTDGNLRMKFPPREGAEAQGSHSLLKRSCSDARLPVSSPLKLPRQFYEWSGRKVAMTTEGLIVSGAFCWWASYGPQSGN